jgi:hypothetical protein
VSTARFKGEIQVEGVLSTVCAKYGYAGAGGVMEKPGIEIGQGFGAQSSRGLERASVLEVVSHEVARADSDKIFARCCEGVVEIYWTEMPIEPTRFLQSVGQLIG